MSNIIIFDIVKTAYERWDDISSDELDNDDDGENENGQHISEGREGEEGEGGGENDDDSDYFIERYIAGTYVLTITFCRTIL